jgi:mRNA (guanine-N7-)-methyltransferase
MVFDAYYIGRKDIRSLALAMTDDDEKHTKTRLSYLHEIIKESNFQPLVGTKLPLTIEEKNFYVRGDIFKNCNEILSKVADDLFIYETDGLIFTPANKGIGSNTVGEVLPPTKLTWNLSFKWKPPEFNTIDFLVTTKKTENNEDFIGNIFENGINMQESTQLTQYKTSILRVGFSERMHGYLNPCEDIIQGNVPNKYDSENRNKYKPVPFYPTDPTPNYPAYLCNIILEESDDVSYMLIEDKTESFEDGTIVEFKYDKTKEPGYQWIPIRVRKKKTAEYKAGKNNFGNAYHVALSVWHSIHNPVTESMIRTGNNIPSELVEDDIYYNRKSNSTITKALRDFHNLFVKRILIMSVSNRGDILIDQSVGKGGDLPKWIAAKLSFVFGIDYSRDNITNRINGACARFLNYKKKWKTMPAALFVSGNSGLNIRSGNACYSEKGKQITKAIFGDEAKDEEKLGAGVYKQFGKGKDGFHIVSNQFSIHYFFENKQILNGFLRNVSECCKVGGYFIGTSYDGTKVFRALEGKNLGEGIRIMAGERKMWEITKKYDSDSFANDVSCLGYKINVYQESINKIFPEYLVNYEYLINLLEQYGFALLTISEYKELGLPNSIGGFNLLFSEMQHQINSKRLRRVDIGDALKMTSDEKKISFLNKYFVFKKIRDVNAEKVEKIQLNLNKEEEKELTEENAKLETIVDNIKTKKPRVKKLGKIKLSTQKQKKSTIKIKLDTIKVKKK